MTHGSHPRGEKLNSSDLSRYPKQMMQGLAAAILCRAGPVLEALGPGGMAPQANPTTPLRRPREPSPSTPEGGPTSVGRSDLGLTSGLGLGHSSGWNIDTEDWQGRGIWGGNSSPGPMGTPGHGDFGSAYHPTDHSRPQYLRQDHVPPDGFQAAPLERRWRKALVGTVGPVGPTAVQSSSAGGQDLCPHFAVGGQAPGVALVGGGVTSLPGGPTGGHQGDSGVGQGD